MTTQNNEQVAVQKKEISYSERFTNAVVKEFSANAGDINITPFQKKLCQNYFIKIDMMLRESELKRMAKPEKYREPVPLTWDNINLQKLATDVIVFSSVGLDPTQPNHINPIPYKNNKTGKYDITFIMGYRGVELKAKKYGYDVPDDVVVEVVYANDTFVQVKKDINNKVENYEFKVSNSFDRGDIVGGFYYLNYFGNPQKNKLRTFSKKDIDKRKPDYASAEFWGGEKDKWVDGKKAGTEQVEGWYDEMVYKTIYRAAYNSITIDSEKIDSNYLSFIVKEGESKDLKLAQEIDGNANKKEIGFGKVEEAEQVTHKEEANDGEQQQPEPVVTEQKDPLKLPF